MFPINKNPSAKELRVFGLVLMAGFGLIGFFVRRAGHPEAAAWLWGVPAAVGLLALAAPPLSKPFYWAWMFLGMALGAVMSRVVMSVIFFLVLTPVALFFRLKGRDALGLKPPQKDSYWSPHPEI